jgi:hypothetical protein
MAVIDKKPGRDEETVDREGHRADTRQGKILMSHSPGFFEASV